MAFILWKVHQVVKWTIFILIIYLFSRLMHPCFSLAQSTRKGPCCSCETPLLLCCFGWAIIDDWLWMLLCTVWCNAANWQVKSCWDGGSQQRRWRLWIKRWAEWVVVTVQDCSQLHHKPWPLSRRTLPSSSQQTVCMSGVSCNAHTHNTHARTHTHTHNHFMAFLDFVQDYVGELAPER